MTLLPHGDLSGRARKVMQGDTLQLCCNKMCLSLSKQSIKPQFILYRAIMVFAIYIPEPIKHTCYITCSYTEGGVEVN